MKLTTSPGNICPPPPYMRWLDESDGGIVGQLPGTKHSRWQLQKDVQINARDIRYQADQQALAQDRPLVLKN